MKNVINRALAAKKKNYIAPSTELLDFASEGLMQNPQIGMATGSGASGTPSTDNMDFIQ